MSDQPDKDLENLFSEELSRANLRRVVRKAKIFVMLRTILISLLSAVVVFVGAFLVNIQLLNVSRQKLESSLLFESRISGPNVYLGSEYTRDGWFGGEAEVHTYKMIEGIPIPWTTKKYEYNFLGWASLIAGDYSPLPQIGKPAGLIAYNAQTEQREMTFYHPAIKYAHYMNDLSLLKNVPSGDFVEIAISFDQRYEFNQIQSMLPVKVHPVWYWVDTYSAQDLNSRSDMPMMPYEVYGFASHPYPSESTFSQTPKDFANAINDGMKFHSSLVGEVQPFRQIYNTLSHGTGTIHPSDVKIIGLVVTGTPEELMRLQGKPFVKAAVLGAIANPY